MSTKLSVTFHSDAANWNDLAARIHDALFDAQHQQAGLHGAMLTLRVLLSRKLLPLDAPDQKVALHRLSAQLQEQGVIHSFHCAAPGSQERGAHRVQITLVRNQKS